MSDAAFEILKKNVDAIPRSSFSIAPKEGKKEQKEGEEVPMYPYRLQIDRESCGFTVSGNEESYSFSPAEVKLQFIVAEEAHTIWNGATFTYDPSPSGPPSSAVCVVLVTAGEQKFLCSCLLRKAVTKMAREYVAKMQQVAQNLPKNLASFRDALYMLFSIQVELRIKSSQRGKYVQIASLQTVPEKTAEVEKNIAFLSALSYSVADAHQSITDFLKKETV